jgi:hypothetical protein
MLIQQEQEFVVRSGKRVDAFRRERDDPSPRFECEKIRITHLSCSDDPKLQPYTFGTEPEWFVQRGVVAQ